MTKKHNTPVNNSSTKPESNELEHTTPTKGRGIRKNIGKSIFYTGLIWALFNLPNFINTGRAETLGQILLGSLGCLIGWLMKRK